MATNNDLGLDFLIDNDIIKNTVDTGNIRVNNNVDKIIASIEEHDEDYESNTETLPEEEYASSRDDTEKAESEKSSQNSIKFQPQSGPYGAFNNTNYTPPSPPRIDPIKELEMKREILYQLDRMAKKGLKMPRTFTLASDLKEMQAEFERLKRDRDVDKSVNFQRHVMMSAVSGIEMLSGTFASKFVKLDGWSNHVNENIGDFDEIFEELYEKYKSKKKWPAEIRLLMSLGGSAALFHLTNTMFKKHLPGMDQVLKENPGLMKQMASAMMGTMSGNLKSDDNKEGGGNLMSGLAGFMSNIMGSMGGGNDVLEHMQRPTHGAMKGPRNFDAMMKELSSGSRIETFSNASETDISELRDDTNSVSGFSLSSKGKKKVLNL
jgi:hypothetical protein